MTNSTNHTNRENRLRDALARLVGYDSWNHLIEAKNYGINNGFKDNIASRQASQIEDLMALFDQQIAKEREEDLELLRDMLLHFHASMNRVQLVDAIKEYRGEGSLNNHLYIAIETAISYFKGKFAIKEERYPHAD